MKYDIDIDERAVLVVVRQYDKNGEEIVISNINVPTGACPACGTLLEEPEHDPSCPLFS